MSKTKIDSISIFKIISFLEGVSYILLLFVAVPIKYMADNATFVKALGMPHGILFVLYILMALFIRSRMKWGLWSTLFVLVASLLPFGTFYVNRKYLDSVL
jgi:integral membrane protein